MWLTKKVRSSAIATPRAEAIDLAIREAQYTHSRGDDVVVCVEQDDGHYALAWSSH